MKSDKIRTVGVVGGSFNPVHYGHFELANKAHEQFNIPLILMMPTSKTYYKDESSLADPYERIYMLELAIKHLDEYKRSFIQASSLDIDRGGNTYTFDTINELKEKYDIIYFIIGSDSLMYIDTWKRADDFLKKCILLVAKREGDNDCDILNKTEFLKKSLGADVRSLYITKHPYSSSMIREKVRRGEDITEYMPKALSEYIIQKGFYRG